MAEYFGKIGDMIGLLFFLAAGIWMILLGKGVLPRKPRDNSERPKKLFFSFGCILVIGSFVLLFMKWTSI